MALNGRLSEFSIPEILQLLALQQKSGVLTLAHEDGRKEQMYFERGYIIAAAEAKKAKDSDFLKSLHDCLHLTKEQMQTISDIAQATSQDIMTVLLTTGMMGRDRLTDEMRRFTQHQMDAIVEWRAGVYEFSGDEKSVPSVGLIYKISTEELLMESMRRNDELASLKESLIGENQVLAKSQESPSQPLPRECQVVLQHVTGRTAVRDLCRISPLGDWPTYDAIAQLLDLQQVIVLDQDQASQLFSKQPRTKVAPAAWLALLTPLALSVLLGCFFKPPFAPQSEGWLPPEVTAAQAEFRAELAREVVLIQGAEEEDLP